MKDDCVYLTFKTDRDTHEFLKLTAHILNKTKPELIEEICKDFINAIKEMANNNIDPNNIP